MGALRRTGAGVDRSEAPSPGSQSATRLADVVWVHEGPVCVTILDPPRQSFHEDACPCGSCQASRHAELAAPFLPDARSSG